MTGTKSGGLKVKKVVLAKNPNFYKENGRLGGLKSRGGGFAANHELARIAGAKGGRISRRKPVKKIDVDSVNIE